MMRLIKVLALLAVAGLAPAQAQQSGRTTGAQDLSVCKAAATALGLVPLLKGNTVFCPTNAAFLHLAEDFGIRGPTAADQLLAVAKANPAVFTQVLSFHVAKGLLPAASLRDNAALPTLLSGAALKVDIDGSKVSLEVPEAGGKGHGQDKDHAHDEADVVAADLTFDGPYAAGRSPFIVHAISDVLVPPVAAPALSKLSRGVLGRKLML